jgi:3-hydroxyisobutyrate dehydrogenase
MLAGGLPDVFEAALPLLERLDRVATLEGGPGAGQHAKVVNRRAIASGMRETGREQKRSRLLPSRVTVG